MPVRARRSVTACAAGTGSVRIVARRSCSKRTDFRSRGGRATGPHDGDDFLWIDVAHRRGDALGTANLYVGYWGPPWAADSGERDELDVRNVELAFDESDEVLDWVTTAWDAREADAHEVATYLGSRRAGALHEPARIDAVSLGPRAFFAQSPVQSEPPGGILRSLTDCFLRGHAAKNRGGVKSVTAFPLIVNSAQAIWSDRLLPRSRLGDSTGRPIGTRLAPRRCTHVRIARHVPGPNPQPRAGATDARSLVAVARRLGWV
jgi:hypothetical protein